MKKALLVLCLLGALFELLIAVRKRIPVLPRCGNDAPPTTIAIGA